MAQVEAPVFRLLFEPKGIPGPGDAIASATTDRSNPSQVTFSFETEGGTFVLHTSRLEVPDPWDERPIQFFPELVCVNLPLVLIRIRSTDSRRFPTLFYVYRFQKGASDTVIKLPKVAHEICASPSFGLVYDSSDYDTYVIANLQCKYNEETKQVDFFLHRWFRSGPSWQSKLNEKVTLPPVPPVPRGIKFDRGKWVCDQVITFKDTLLWVDLNQGVILLCKNPLQKGEANFDFIRLPKLKSGGPRPQTFMRVDCCIGKLKLVKINDCSDVSTVYLTIMTFNEKSYEKSTNKWFSRNYWNTTGNSNPLICGDFWAAMKNMPALQLLSSLEASGNHMPCFPVLSTYDDKILHLVMVRKDYTDAWLLQVNTQSCDLEAAAAYPGFSNHQKPLYSSNFPSQ